MSKSNNTRNEKDLLKIVNWKDKAKRCRIENENLKRRQKEILLSRDNWKAKYQEKQRAYIQLEKAYSKLGSQQLNDSKSSEEFEKGKHHSYSSKVIMFFIGLRSSTASLRSCITLLEILLIVYKLDLGIILLQIIA